MKTGRDRGLRKPGLRPAVTLGSRPAPTPSVVKQNKETRLLWRPGVVTVGEQHGPVGCLGKSLFPARVTGLRKTQS